MAEQDYSNASTSNENTSSESQPLKRPTVDQTRPIIKENSVGDRSNSNSNNGSKEGN